MSRLAELGFAAIAVLGLASAQAAPGDDFLKCASIAQAEARLACYDKAAADLGAVASAPVATPQVAEAPQAVAPATKPKKKHGAFFGLFGHKEAVATAPAPVSAAPTPPAPAPSEVATAQPAMPVTAPASLEDQFGGERLPKPEAPKEARVNEIRSAVDEYAFTPYGKLIVFLNNGQVWRQLQSDDANFYLRKGKSYVAVVSRGMLGSYNLSFEGIRAMAKAQRIK